MALKSDFQTLIPLPGTSKEAQSVIASLKALSATSPVLYEQQFALEYAAKNLEGPEYVTFATHGFFTAPSVLEVVLDDQDSENFRSANMPNNVSRRANPLLQCGLLLAGCNITNSIIENDDGVLTGLEISGLNLDGTKLVVLSACETAVGEIKAGEGVAGLHQAFQLAGAESVLATLWQVDDLETSRLMGLFFENLTKGLAKSEALRQAQLTRIKSRRARHGAAHPIFWAAFTLTGQD